jgi:lipoprotein-anchoring transpeptidase ErfK/SrfK
MKHGGGRLRRVLMLASSAALLSGAALWPAAAGATPSVSHPTPAAPTPAVSPPTPAAPTPAAPGEVQLSNELTLTVWAHPESQGAIYSRPEAKAPRVAKVRLYDPDGFLNVYVLLGSYVDAQGNEWVRVRVPGRPNGRVGWLRRELLGSFQYTRWRIVVERAARRMRVFYDGRLLRVFPVGVGKPSTPTPAGHFWIDERFKLSNPSSPYWPYALGTSDYSTLPDWPGEGVVGIHGPYGEPQKIPGDPSHGCIRMLSTDIAWLGPRVTLGTPVDVVA